MNSAEFNAFCALQPAATYVCQWGGADVWKIGGKVFAIGSSLERGGLGITFKAAPLSYEILRDQPGLRPAPYLASRGLKWIQYHDSTGLAVEDLKYYLIESYKLVAAGLPNKTKIALGICLRH